MGIRVLETDRLVLRGWRAEDHEPYAALNADPVVMEHFPGTLTRDQSDAHAERCQAVLEARGWGLWAVELRSSGAFLGFVGLDEPWFDEHFTPAVEVGWRLARPHWGRGYAPEAAAECLRFAFDELALDEVVSFTTPANRASQRVMQKLGMVQDPAGDFEHPGVPPGHRVRRHVLYRLASSAWRARPGPRLPTPS